MPRTADQGRRAEALRLYALNLPTRTIAAQLGADPRTVQRWLGDSVRRRGPRKKPVPDAEILDMRERQQLSWAEIAELTGMSASGVRQRYWAITGRPRADRHVVTGEGPAARNERGAGNELSGHQLRAGAAAMAA